MIWVVGLTLCLGSGCNESADTAADDQPNAESGGTESDSEMTASKDTDDDSKPKPRGPEAPTLVAEDLAFNEDCRPSRAAWDEKIKPFVEQFCGECHSETLAFGATYSLLDYEGLFSDTTGERPIDGTIRRLTEGTMPPPSQPKPGADVRKEILDWATCGQWRKGTDDLPNPGGAFDADKPIIGQSEPPLDGTDFFELRANQFEVGVDEKDRYECFTFELPITEDRFIRRVETVVGDARVLHHAILLPEGEGEPGTHARCEDDNPLSLVYGWAPGQGALQFPEGGIRIRPGQRMTVNIHYNNTGRHEGVKDSSGVRIYHGPAEGKEVSMLTFGPWVSEFHLARRRR